MKTQKKEIPKKKGGQKLLWWVGGILIFLVIGYFGISAYVAYIAGIPGPHPQYTDDPGTFGLPFSDHKFKARGDDINVAAWYIPNSNADRAVILVHGRDASKQNAITGKLPKLGYEIYNAGYSVLMIDTRGYGESEGKRYSFGIYERRDVLGAVDFLMDKGYKPGNIAALGISNGGAAVIGAASEESAIGAIILDSTLSDLNPLIENGLKEKGLPAFFRYGADIMSRLIFGYSLMSVKPNEEIVDIPPRPILIMHCSEDDIINVSHAQQLHAAVPEAEFILFDSCSHAELYRDQPQEYINAVLPFLQETW